MMVIEMREAAREKAFDLVEELHELGHEKKMVLCELEDTLYDCFEDSKEDDMESEKSDEGTDLGFKSKYNRHYAMRNFDDDMDTHRQYRRSMRMRRNRMGRYA
jgi:hypothetical protein